MIYNKNGITFIKEIRMKDMVKVASDYKSKYGFCVIPAKGKVPLVNWTEFQDTIPTDEQIESWWANDDANIAIVTGKVSGCVCVVDVDAYKNSSVMDSAKALLHEGLEFPISTTPRDGEHWWFRSEEQLGDKIGFIAGCDFRSKGIIVMPPSEGYEWKVSLEDVEIPLLPAELAKTIKSAQVSMSHPTVSHKGEAYFPQGNMPTSKELSTKLYSKDILEVCGSPTFHKDYFADGRRDNDLFSVANALIKSSVDPGLATESLARIVHTWGDNDPVWIRTKVKSAMKRHEIYNLAAEVRDWVGSTKGTFSSTEIHKDLQLSTKLQKKNCSEILRRLVGTVIERVGDRNGQFRKIESDLEKMNWKDVRVDDYYDLKMPLGLHQLCHIYKTNIIIIAGSPNSGKSSFCLNIAKINRDKDVRYFNSEMGNEELKNRLSLFEGMELKDWDHVEFYERSTNFSDVIYPDSLNIIDYVEITKDFFKVGGVIMEIHEKLKDGICVICLQKNRGVELGRGGGLTEEKARLYISMDYQKLKIVKCKNPRLGQKVSGKEIDFKLVDGTTFIQVSQ
jgi:hypothetical protein